jgi:hypothetical protein
MRWGQRRRRGNWPRRRRDRRSLPPSQARARPSVARRKQRGGRRDRQRRGLGWDRDLPEAGPPANQRPRTPQVTTSTLAILARPRRNDSGGSLLSSVLCRMRLACGQDSCSFRALVTGELVLLVPWRRQIWRISCSSHQDCSGDSAGCAGAIFVPGHGLALLGSANGNRRLEADQPCANRKNPCSAVPLFCR